MLANIAHWPDIDLATWQEGHGAEVDSETALPTKDSAGHTIIIFETRSRNPGFLAARFTAEHGFTVTIFHALDIDFDDVAGLQFGLAWVAKFLQRHTTFGLQSNVDQGRVIVDRNNGTPTLPSMLVTSPKDSSSRAANSQSFPVLGPPGCISHVAPQ